MNNNELNLGEILVRLKRNKYIQDLTTITKAASMEKGRKSAMLGQLKANLGLLRGAANHPNFSDVKNLDKLSANIRATTFATNGQDAFFDYPNKFIAYSDIMYHISHLEWAIWRVSSMKTA